MEYMEYSLILNIINKDIDDENTRLTEIENIKNSNNSPLRLNLPSHLNIK